MKNEERVAETLTEEQKTAFAADYWRDMGDGRFGRSPYGGRQELAPPVDEGGQWTLTDVHYYGEPTVLCSSLEEAMSAANKIVDDRIQQTRKTAEDC